MEDTYTFTPGNGVSTTLDEPSGAERVWVFSAGWLSEVQCRASLGAPQALRHEYYTWVQEPASLNFYVGTVRTVLDEGQPYAATTQTVQTQDSYGNVLTTQVYDYPYGVGPSGQMVNIGSMMGSWSSDLTSAHGQYVSMVGTVFTFAAGVTVANTILGANGGTNPCAGMFNLAPYGETLASLSSQVTMLFSPLGDTSTFAETFGKTDKGNPNPGHYTIVFNTDVGNPNVTGGVAEAANTLIHELLHVASLTLGPGAVPEGWSDEDGGTDKESIQNQRTNQDIITANCFH